MLDESAKPVADAAILVYVADRPVCSAGRTSAEGLLLLGSRRELAAPYRVVAVHDSYAAAAQLVTEPVEEVLLVLAEATPLSGQVTFGGQPLPVAGLRVVAQDVAAPRVDKARALDLDDPELASLSGVTDEHGRFTIAGAREGRRYELAAGGAGYYGLHRVSPTATPLERARVSLPVDKIFGAVTRFVDERGADVAMPAFLKNSGWQRRIRYEVEGADMSRARPLHPGSPFVLLSGLDPFFVLDRPQCVGLVLVVIDLEQPDLGLLSDSGHLPGFEPFRVTYELLPLSAGLAHVEIPLRPTGDGLARLRVRFVDASTGKDLSNELAPLPGMLDLYPGEELALSQARLDRPADLDFDHPGGLKVHLASEGDSGLDLEGLPYGTYAVKYTNEWATFLYPSPGAPNTLLRVADQEVEFVLPVETTGSVSLALLHADGTPYQGGLYAMLEPLQPNGDAGAGSGFSSFAEPPYLIEGVATGRTKLRILQPSVVDGHGEGSEREVLVRAGETAHVSLVVQ